MGKKSTYVLRINLFIFFSLFISFPIPPAFAEIKTFSKEDIYQTSDYTKENQEAISSICTRADELIRNGKYDEAITLLDPVYPYNFATAYRHQQAYEYSKKQREYVKLVRKEADSGNPNVAYFLASTLKNHWIIEEPTDIEKYFLIAHNGGVRLATRELGYLYYSGLTSTSIRESKPRVPVNLEKSKLMFSSCSNDSIVGLECAEGVGHVMLDLYPDKPSEAIKEFLKSRAYGTLWSLYYFGIGIPRDVEVANSYKNKAIEAIKTNKGQIDCYMKVRDSSNGLEARDPKAIVDIAFGFYSNPTIGYREASCFPARPRLHLELLEKAASLGSMCAVQTLADYYYHGTVAPKNLILAHLYASILSMDGNSEMRQEGIDRLMSLEKTMTRSSVDEARAMLIRWRSIQKEIHIEDRKQNKKDNI